MSALSQPIVSLMRILAVVVSQILLLGLPRANAS
jgi:hypothetical protein